MTPLEMGHAPDLMKGLDGEMRNGFRYPPNLILFDFFN